MQEQKQHSACDQCRRRKLKCPGEQPICSRCSDEQIDCNYSPRKVMGRPRKRMRGADDPSESTEHSIQLDEGAGEGDDSYPALDIPISTFDDWVLPSAAVAGGHDEDMQAMLQQNGNGLEPDLAAPVELLDMEWAQGQGYLPSPYSQDDNGPEINGDIVEDSVSIGRYYAARSDDSNAQASDEPCSCLSSMYLAASSLERSKSSGFPVALTPLRAALQTARVILLCRSCPTERASGCQNVMVLHALLNSIAMGFDRLLININNEVKRATEAGETKALDIGDRSSTNAHFHTGDTDCPARFSMELVPEEWGMLTKRVVKNCIWGNNNGALTLERLLDATEARQKAWHTKKAPSKEDALHGHDHDFTCLRLSAGVRRVMSGMVQ